LNEYYNDFSDSTIDNSFYYIRTPYKTFHSASARPGYLRLKGNSYALGDRDNAAALLRKQTSYEEVFEVELDFSPSSNLTEAGATIYNNDFLHNEIGITSSNGTRVILTRTIVQAVQEDQYPLTYLNNTVKTVSKF
jgi:beta-xylosidase